MMPAITKWNASIAELIGAFRDAMCVLIPVVERVHMPWKEPDAYDDWDQICSAIYRSIVIGSVENADEIASLLPIPDYDRRISSYEINSFIGDATSREGAAFVCFQTDASPFDRCLFALLDHKFHVVGEKRIATEDVKFVLVCRCDDQDSKFFESITVSL